MKLLYHSIFLQHDTGMHPENPKRLQLFNNLPEQELLDGEPYLSLVHTPAYIEKVRTAHLHTDHLDSDTVITPTSFAAATAAVGATIMASKTGDFALVRPPGHHAYRDRASGFCLFNNIAIATQRLVNEGKRVLIVDFDGHLGDGTSHIFYDTDQVLYWSLHQYPAFPNRGLPHEIGSGKGKGFTFNVILPPHAGDDIFMDGFNSFLPLAKQFQPDVVAISAGFDAHIYDLLLDLRVTTNSFFRIGQLLRANFDHLFATLEGGYNISELPSCVYSFLAGVNGEPLPKSELETTSDATTWEAYELQLHTTLGLLQAYWKV
jgi:acetoin utilization deacetylase AcuC-like enzyme